jgi:hypothetical protein
MSAVDRPLAFDALISGARGNQKAALRRTIKVGDIYAIG